MVHNARDTEATQWDDRERTLAGAVQTGPATITWSRPAGVRSAVGLGWAGDFGRWHVGTEWTSALFGRGPTSDVEIDAPGWSAAGAREVDDAITDEFSRLVFNRYHLFVLEFGRRFQARGIASACSSRVPGRRGRELARTMGGTIASVERT